MTSRKPTSYKEALASLRTRTAPSSAAVRRVRARLDRQLLPTTDLLGALPSPSLFALTRIRARLFGEERAPAFDLPASATRKGRGLGWLIPAGGLAFAAAAFALAVATGPEPTPAVPDSSVSTPSTVTPRCDVKTDLTLDVGDACLPTTAAGWLTRARALEDRGAAAAQVLAAADAGVALGAEDAVRSELEVTRMGALLRSGRAADALAAAEAALPGAGPDRAEELHRAAARLALASGDCARALPHLEALTAPTADELAHTANCGD